MDRTRLPLLAILALGACTGTPASSHPSRLEVDWAGTDTGRIAGRATAEWCDSLRVLELRAVRGDSGFALALYPTDSVRPDSYPVRPPDQAESRPPAAAVALRWFAETAIRGFRGDSGAVVVVAAGPRGLTGRFGARVQSVNDTGRLVLRGSFRDVPVVPAVRGCVSRPVPEPADSGID